MPKYIYTAKNIEGKITHGTLEVADEAQLAIKLHEENLFLVQYKEHKEYATSNTKLKSLEIADFCRQIGTMLAAGVSLIRAVNIIMQRDLSVRIRNVYANLYRRLQHGIALSEAMREQGNVFPELLSNMIRAGEASGQLDITMMKMADHYDKEYKLNHKVKSSMTYPFILLIITIVIVMLLFTVILPEFFTLFEGMELPLPTRIVLGISGALSTNWQHILIVAIVIIAIVAILTRIDSFRIMMDKNKLSIPKIGKLLKIIYTARFARTLSSLYASGLPMMSALQISRDTIGNRYISSKFDDMVMLVRNGIPLSQAIKTVEDFDSKLASTIMIGEETGKLDDILNSVADSFDFEAEMATQRLTTIIEPLLIIIMAGLVGSIMLSVMMPIYQLYQNIG
ncbi:MAG: type II secretion system F family protein [Bacillota bacterium]